jgi:hypothetical protein
MTINDFSNIRLLMKSLVTCSKQLTLPLILVILRISIYKRRKKAKIPKNFLH